MGKEAHNMPVQTEQEKQFAQFTTECVEMLGKAVADGDSKLQANLDDAVGQIAKLSDDFEAVRAEYRKRFAEHVEKAGRAGPYRGQFASREAARDFGRAVIAMCRGRTDPGAAPANEMGKLLGHEASVSGITGPGGGYLLGETLIDGIIRNVEDAGVFERHARRFDIGSQTAKLTRRTQGVSGFYPDIGAQHAGSEPKFAAIKPELTMYSVYTPIDRSMLQDDVAVAVAEFVREEMAYTLARMQDDNAFIGDGSDSYARVLGAFNRSNAETDVTADGGDNTFVEVIAKSTDYLTLMAGGIESQFDDGNLAYYLHRTIFFRYWGMRDSQGRPLMGMIANREGGGEWMLAGYPARITPSAPKLSQSAASKAMVVLANLARGYGLFRHRAGFELRASEEFRFLNNELSLVTQVRQQVQQLDPGCQSRLVTNAA